MKKHIEDRVKKHCLLYIQRDMNIRKVAEQTGCSKQTVYKDLTDRAKEINIDLYHGIQEKMHKNKIFGRLRGAYKTQELYTGVKRKKENKQNG